MGNPTWKIAQGTSSSVIFESFENFGAIDIASDRSVVLRNILGASGGNSVAGGKLFIEDVCGCNWQFNKGLRVWARQLNPEAKSTGDWNIRNCGAVLWILGLKTEGPRTVIEMNNGAATEVLGAYIYPSSSVDPVPAFICEESSFSIAICNNYGNIYPTFVREIRKGVLKEQAKMPFCYLYVGKPDGASICRHPSSCALSQKQSAFYSCFDPTGRSNPFRAGPMRMSLKQHKVPGLFIAYDESGTSYNYGAYRKITGLSGSFFTNR
jgi:hypothetical protein